jgi:HK97 gp10 family phage protein
MITATWVGLEEAIRNAEALGKELATEEVLRPALLKAGVPLKDEIVRTAPRSRDNKHMADSFVLKASAEERDFGRTTVLVGPKAGKGSQGFVAPFVEFGTSRMGSQPFIRPAFDAFKGTFPGALAGHLRAQYDRVVKKYTKRAAK